MIGQQIDNFRILELLGVGGMGEVWKAIDVNLDRFVALKVITAGLQGNPDLLARFKVEARVQAALNHPNIATLYAFLVWEGKAVMVMEYVEGETLRDLIASRGALPVQPALNFCKQALVGIEAAHRQGVVHRDLKPANLMLNKAGVVKVMDFGIAKVQDGAKLTRTNAPVGTYCYMAPEQIQRHGVDARSDIYSMGITLYEMLTGNVPFDFDSDFEIQSAHVHTPPPLPTAFNPSIPEAVVAVVMRALEKNPDHRFANAGEFMRALPDLGATVPPVSRPDVVGRPTVFESPRPSVPQPNATGRPTELLPEATTVPPQPNAPPVRSSHPVSPDLPVMPHPQPPTNGRGAEGSEQGGQSSAKRRKNRGVLVGALCVILIGAGLGAAWVISKPKATSSNTSSVAVDSCPQGEVHGPSGVCQAASAPGNKGPVTPGRGAGNVTSTKPQPSPDKDVAFNIPKIPHGEVINNPQPAPTPHVTPAIKEGPLSGAWTGSYIDSRKQESTSIELLLSEKAEDSTGLNSVTGTMNYNASDQGPGKCLVRGSAYDPQQRQLKLTFTGCTKTAGSLPAFFNSFTLFKDVSPTSNTIAKGHVYGQQVTATLYRKQ
jgi:serine/threonine-protein kinase